MAYGLAPNLKLVDMPLGKGLYEPGKKLSHAYFPTESIISKLYVTESGASAEILMVGNEGMVGVALFMGGESTPMAQIAACNRHHSIGQQLCRWQVAKTGRHQVPPRENYRDRPAQTGAAEQRVLRGGEEGN